jgi:CDP-glycerol glycerophosphotransferase
VSIIVIGYNDAEHLPAALRSAQMQTLRDIEVVVVDDASRDESLEIANGYAARDSRFHVHQLDTNSGGCSRPRNTGLDYATGEFVLFLDSDDVLPRRAASLLYAAASRANADVTCGRMVRRHHHPRRHLASNDELYRRAEVLDGVLARPAQLRDTPACGKLFRREFLDANDLRFPERLLFEDLLFTTTAYATARRIAIVPTLCYVWNVRRQQAEPSITNRRELRNWRDRFEIHRRIDENLASRPRATELLAAKDRKFLTVDWPIYLRELRSFPAEQRAELLDLAADYFGGRDLVADVQPGLRVAAFLTRCRDLDAALTAADYVTTGGIGTDLVVEQDRVYWTRRHLGDTAGRQALDVTSTGVLTADFAVTPFLAVVRQATATGDSLTLTGHVHDVLGRLGGDVTASLLVRGRLGGRVLSSPATLTTPPPAGQGLEFSVTLDLSRLAQRLHPGVAHELRFDLDLHRGEAQAQLPVTARDAQLPEQSLSLPNRWAVVLGTSGGLLERNGRLVLDLAGVHPVVDRSLDVATRGRSFARRRLTRHRP